MSNKQSRNVSLLTRAHEAAFSLNFAFGCVALVLLNGPRPLTTLLIQMEKSLDSFLGIKDSDFITGYWEVLIPVGALGVLLWALLYVSRKTRLASKVLRTHAGVSGIAVAPTIWLYATYVTSRRYGWNPFGAVQLYEFVLVLLMVIMYVRGVSLKLSWQILLIVLVHFGFWFWQFNPRPFFSTYSGPVAPAIGLCSTLIWVFYANSVWVLENEPPTAHH